MVNVPVLATALLLGLAAATSDVPPQEQPVAETTTEMTANKITIKDSQIVLTWGDRQRLIQAIADSLVRNQSTALRIRGADGDTSAPLLPLDRDAFLYLKDDGAVRLGWRFPLATWPLYRDLLSCGVGRQLGSYFYC
ncbi:hypothetical protein PINS_up011113 [Pythium insidiosum]|nr:hypothetical protein PINS_up011113 [Pythium insidiosum]